MKAIKQRTFAFSCCAFIFFSYLFYFCSPNTKIISIAFSIVLGSILLFFGKNAKFASFYLLLPVIISSIISLSFFTLHYNKITSNVGETADIEFVILEENYTSETFSTYTVRIENINGEKSNAKATLSVGCDLSAELFSVHSCRATIELPNESQYGFSARNYGLSKGIFISAHAASDVTSLGETRKSFPTYYLHKTNEFFSSIIDKYIPIDQSAFSKALILGDTSVLEPKDNLNFRLLGLSHALAVSGTHLTILIGSFDALLSKLKLSKNKRCIIVILLTIFYAGLTGFSPAVKRSAIMMILSSISFLMSKTHDPLTSLCFSGAFLCALEPHALFDIGLQLSFLSTMGIIVFAIPTSSKLTEKAKQTESKILKILYTLSSALLFGIAPIMFSLPVIWLAFGEISLLSPLTNILFTPFITLVMYSCPIMLLASFIPFITKIISFIPGYTSVFILKLADILANKTPVVSINYNFTAYIVAFLVISLIILLLYEPKNKFVFLVPFIVCVASFAVCISAYNQNNAGKTKAVYTNNMYGDSFLIINEGNALFCDISGCSYPTAKECEYYLGENHITRLDSYLVTDYNERGIETIEKLSTLTRIDRLLLPYPTTNEEILLADSFLKCAKDNNIKHAFYDYETNNQIIFANTTIDINKLTKTQINSPSSICLTFSTDTQKFSYIGKGCYSTSYGKQHLTNIFNDIDTIVFGSYGKDTKTNDLMTLLYRPNIKVYFASDSLYKDYQKNVAQNAVKTVTGKYFEFELK